MRNVELNELKIIASNFRGAINKVYLHWTAGRYNQFFEDYHILIGEHGEIILTTEYLNELKYHTWRRNTGAIGIGLCCCYGANANQGHNTDFGNFPPTDEQIEMLSLVIDCLSKSFDLEINENNFLTHCEAALLDGYGPFSGDPETRWDLWYLRDYDGSMIEGGKLLRGKAIWYSQHPKGVVL